MANSHKVRYIIGAGASANSVKTVQGFHTMFSDWGATIPTSPRESFIEVEKLQKLGDELRAMALEIKSTFSVDTYARMLWLRGDTQGLARLKALITLVLTLEQKSKQPDKRYDVFLSSLLQKENSEMSFPSNIQIVSWNYDFQIELVLAKILNNDGGENQTKIFGENQFISINGSGLCEHTFAKDISVSRKQQKDVVYKNKRVVEKAIEVLNEESQSLGGIKFFWESKQDFENINSFDPDVTVVIGYSFPTFNREVDLQLFAGKQHDLGHKVYIQCNGPSSLDGNKEVKSKLLGMGFNEKSIQDVETSNEFLIPFEFNLLKTDWEDWRAAMVNPSNSSHG